MRLRDMKVILEENIDKLKVNYTDAHNKTYELIDYRRFINAADELAALNFLETDINKLRNFKHVYFNKSSSPNIVVDAATLKNLQDLIGIIKQKSEAVYEAIDQAIADQAENSVSIMLPPTFKDLDEITNFFKELELALKLGLNNEPIKVQTFDSGSFWIELLANNQDTLSFLGSLITSATTCLTLYIENKKTQQHLSNLVSDSKELKDQEKLQFNSKLNEQLKELMEQRLHNLISAEAQMLKEKHPERAIDEEYSIKLEKSIYTTVKLLSEGTKVIPALNAPAEVVSQFPDETLSKEIEKRVQLFLNQNGQKQIIEPESGFSNDDSNNEPI